MMEPGTECVVDPDQVGPRGGKMYKHANPQECARSNPARMSNPYDYYVNR